jgi:hypothetical protein
MASTEHQDRVKNLQKAADQWFKDQKAYIEAEYDFLDSIAATRGGSMTLQNAIALGAANVLENSINDYLGRPLEPPK